MERVYNFSPGPAALPVEVLEKAQKEFVVYQSSGMSVMEMSHRSKEFLEIIQGADSGLRKLMKVPDNYKILFLQGGASTQFSMVPLNLFKNRKADYINTGQWSTKAIEEASRFGEVKVVASSEDTVFDRIPKWDPAGFTKDADYFHITMNNTIYGTRFTTLPETGSVPLVTDMSSSILSQRYDVSRFGIIYAGAQKNIGPAGLCIVIIREDLIGYTMPNTPIMLDYATHAKNESLYNTPPSFGVYMAKLMFEWLETMGGVEGIEKYNIEKAALLYDYLDNSSMFKGTVVKEDRSLMNIPFVTGNKDLDEKFIKEAKSKGLVTLGGHRTVGGMRASVYNAMPMEGVRKLVGFMKEFEKDNK